MTMVNPPHPGEIINGFWLDPMDISITEAAQAMDVSRKTLAKVINGKGRIIPGMAIRLSISLGGGPENWLGHQTTYDLWQAEQHRDELKVVPLMAAD